MPVPKYDQLFNPTLAAIKKLGGSASILELNDAVSRDLGLSDADLMQLHDPDDSQTELEYRLAWARTYLKKFGLLDNSERGVWSVTQVGRDTEIVDPIIVKRHGSRRAGAGKEARNTRHNGDPKSDIIDIVDPVLQQQSWKEGLLATLRSMAPDAFERLCQRLLRESGFVEVRVTGRSGDGGIDGVGRVQLGGLLGFPVVFQCKRWHGGVGSNVVREFRGAMMGRADRGLIITTGTFTRDARQEATRDGVPPIDLVDGDELMDKLKELRLGVSIKMIEEVSVHPDWYAQV